MLFSTSTWLFVSNDKFVEGPFCLFALRVCLLIPYFLLEIVTFVFSLRLNQVVTKET